MSRNLVRDILLSLKKTFEDFRDVASKYHLLQRPRLVDTEHDNRHDSQLKRVWTLTKDLGLHFILVMKDKDRIQNLIQDLTELNNGLESTLSNRAKGTVCEVSRLSGPKQIQKYKEPAELKVFLSPNKPGETPCSENDLSVIPRQHEALAATAKIKRLIVMSGMSGVPSISNSKVRKEQFWLIVASRRTSPILPWHVSLAAYKPESNDSSFPVLIEWRKPDRQSPQSKISMEEFTPRRNHVVAVLHETSNVSRVAMPACRVLYCVSWFISIRQESGTTCELVGFASRLPSWADPRRPPVSLRRLLDRSVHDGGRSTPSLRTRFKLAAALAQAIYQLQCSHWLHRALNSYQVLFFYDVKTSILRVDVPLLAGLLYSRPNDQRVDERVFETISEGKVMGQGPMDVYMHPELMVEPRRYRRSDDVYNLGVILLEIALWDSATEYCSLELNDYSAEALAGRISEAATEELAAEVGELYQRAVFACLKGLWRWDFKMDMDDLQIEGKGYDGTYGGENSEYGLESGLLWKVVRQLEKLRV